jgi:hypothetical protein
MLVSNLFLGLGALPKLLRHWWPQNPQLEGVRRDITSSSQEHINTEEVSTSPEYPDSIQMTEKGVLTESSDQLC